MSHPHFISIGNEFFKKPVREGKITLNLCTEVVGGVPP